MYKAVLIQGIETDPTVEGKLVLWPSAEDPSKMAGKLTLLTPFGATTVNDNQTAIGQNYTATQLE
jgi:hypothetical protein